MSVTLHTDMGDLKLEIHCSETPKAAENFLALCASGYYDGSLLHRNIRGFMVQMGDPTGTGKGGNSIWGRKFEDEIRTKLQHDRRGVVSMANSGPDTNGSQFFITYDQLPNLDSKYTVFGRVADGADTTLDAIERVEVNKKNRPLKDIHLRSVTIHANPLADPDCIR
ncbi:Peptidyl-prolyl cis-trans isomerase cyp10 [Coemansia thaxteri]|uniref:Peptidyl-prolyl cis-trans isomerase n=1 Tax=Coemansia thaxteri TaxID=2663907 RepID=A0A9W8BDN2_9FUNG|nr:Peptidyl-prolyl cis-trans isomerase cyp10 [Coemansia thaxteri]KAJ2005334.1 Peptidyl-prolyl cis-trans isomerase cyp10 [Coemansia thaxteri]KAJ2466912.1 Peptidyl-prolyl cis-trans isomerase cyp10 [Coemansia sp. RSA 2322]KAJ2485515.1 Peptidyl-prolyl cis-trans isomerase cyp10 [Coemansia sp. RSA 2320]